METPYRAEKESVRVPDTGQYVDGGAIFLKGEGKIATATSYMAARDLVDLANEAVARKRVGYDR